MSPLASLETALWAGGYNQLAESHPHRAIREDSLRVIKGRDAIIAAWVAQGRDAVDIAVDLGDMVVVAGKSWRLHRWVWREDGCIVREVEVTDRVRELTAPPVHPPLGELRAGRGQFAASPEPDLPPGFPETARSLATRLHLQWNGRDFSGNVPDAIRALAGDLPDATFLFEHAVVGSDATAILFRIAGHHANGQRVRLIGSVISTAATTEVLIDMSAYAAQLEQSLIDYSAA